MFDLFLRHVTCCDIIIKFLLLSNQQFLDRLFEKAKLHVEAGVVASRPWPFEMILTFMFLEHEKSLVELKSRLKVKDGNCKNSLRG